MIEISDITVRIGSKVLIEHSSANISDGQKVGLVGSNGCGKSTLFKVIKGELETETGSVYFPPSYKLAYVTQEIEDNTIAVLDFVLAQDFERAQLLAHLETADVLELAEIHDHLNRIQAASAPARASSILNGLGFSNEDMLRPIKEFSGGWQMRMALAAALFRPSDILLLDEPTNHLDLETSIWLENHLQKYSGTLVVISHDKPILNSLCNHIIHFDNGKLCSYNGNYDTFQRTRAMQQELLLKQASKQEKKRQHLQSFIDRFKAKASKAKQAQSRMKMLEKMEEISLIEDSAATKFDFPSPKELASPLINIEHGSVGYDGKAILTGLNFSIVEDDRIALLGANGNGKSTLAKLLSQRLPLMSGDMNRYRKLTVGYFSQHQAEELPLSETPVEFMGRLMKEPLETKVRSHLARFGLEKDKALATIKNLSGGEKAKLVFSAMTYSAPGLLILDEPTNHLDMDTRDALITALNDYRGAVILITHDLHLIELIADDLWIIKDGKCKKYDGDLQDYRDLLLNSNKSAKKEKSSKEKGKRVNMSLLSKIEKDLESLHIQKQNLEEKLLLESNHKLLQELGMLNQEVEKLEEKWLQETEKGL